MSTLAFSLVMSLPFCVMGFFGILGLVTIKRPL